MNEFNEIYKLLYSAEERDQCMTIRAKLEQRFKKTNEEVASLHVRISQQFDLKRQKEDVEMSLTACKAEVSSLTNVDKTRLATIEALHLDKNTTSAQLAKTKEENKNLHEELDKVFENLNKDILFGILNYLI